MIMLDNSNIDEIYWYCTLYSDPINQSFCITMLKLPRTSDIDIPRVGEILGRYIPSEECNENKNL